MVSKKVFIVLGSFYLIFGLMLSFFSFGSITGFAVSSASSPTSGYLFGIGFMVIGLIFMTRSRLYERLWHTAQTERILNELIEGTAPEVPLRLILQSAAYDPDQIVQVPQTPGSSARYTELKVKNTQTNQTELLKLDRFGPKKLLYFPRRVYEVPLILYQSNGAIDTKHTLDWHGFFTQYQEIFQQAQLSIDTVCGRTPQ